MPQNFLTRTGRAWGAQQNEAIEALLFTLVGRPVGGEPATHVLSLGFSPVDSVYSFLEKRALLVLSFRSAFLSFLFYLGRQQSFKSANPGSSVEPIHLEHLEVVS